VPAVPTASSGSHAVRAAVRCLLLAALLYAVPAAADFGTRGGQAPANIDAVAEILRQDPFDLELLISYGTSKGGSAGHLALAIRDQAAGDDMVYSANFYADRTPEHDKHFYTDDLMVAIPKREYLFATTSSLGGKASFGLDFGEIYKRSVIGVRVHGVPAAEKAALVAFFKRVNDDYHNRVGTTEYHDGEIKYDYLRFNCAKTIGAGFKYGAGYRDLDVTSARFFSRRKLVVAANANIPTEMAMKLMAEWNRRGYRMDAVLYQKYEGSTYVDPHEDEKVEFKDLPDRFPSVLSRDFRKEQGEYEDFDNLFAIYVLSNMRKYNVRVNDGTKLLEIAPNERPMTYAEAAEIAAKSAASDSDRFSRRGSLPPSGTDIGAPADAAVKPPTSAGAPTLSRFRSPDDGWLDLSAFLDTAYGFVPLVIPITEPAVGYGAVGALVFIDKPKVESTVAGFGRPNLSVIAGLGTENGTKGVFAGDLRHWQGDRVKSLVGGVDASVNLDYYGLGRDDTLRNDPRTYNMEVQGGVAQGKYRLGDSPNWIGLGYVLATTIISFDALPGLPGIPDFKQDARIAGLLPSFTYDSRDNVFTPTGGTYLDASAGLFSTALGGSEDFQRVALTGIHYAPLDPKLTFGVRGTAQASYGDVPFYLRPFISLRGVAAMRYQGDQTAEVEAELRWQFWRRFSLVAFGGTGTAWSEFERKETKVSVVSGGVGLRYELAEKYGLHVGLDLAFGPNSPVIYVQFGNAWMRP
jgi:Omp85 superfamily domain